MTYELLLKKLGLKFESLALLYTIIMLKKYNKILCLDDISNFENWNFFAKECFSQLFPSLSHFEKENYLILKLILYSISLEKENKSF